MAQLSQQCRDHAGAGVRQMLAELGLGASLHASQGPAVFGLGQPLQPGQGRLGTCGRPKAAVERAAKDSDVVPGDRRAEGQVVADLADVAEDNRHAARCHRVVEPARERAALVRQRRLQSCEVSAHRHGHARRPALRQLPVPPVQRLHHLFSNPSAPACRAVEHDDRLVGSWQVRTAALFAPPRRAVRRAATPGRTRKRPSTSRLARRLQQVVRLVWEQREGLVGVLLREGHKLWVSAIGRRQDGRPRHHGLQQLWAEHPAGKVVAVRQHPALAAFLPQGVAPDGRRDRVRATLELRPVAAKAGRAVGELHDAAVSGGQGRPDDVHVRLPPAERTLRMLSKLLEDPHVAHVLGNIDGHVVIDSGTIVSWTRRLWTPAPLRSLHHGVHDARDHA
eukprot:scaffold36319_cov53-Phaeocystis_antarctica.AAC.7